MLSARLIGLAFLLSATGYAAEPAHPAGTTLRPTDAGWYVTTAEKRALYTFASDKDHPGESACRALCEQNWAPYLADDDKLPAGWSIIERKDKKRQWTYKGQPLYTFRHDQADTMYGDMHDKAWHVVFEPVDTPPGIEVGSTVIGRVLTTPTGAVVYAPTTKPAPCKGACVESEWIAVAAPWTAKARGDWSVIKTAGGISQWAYRGKALFTAADARAGLLETTPKGWQPIVLEAAPAAPNWVLLQKADLGPLFTDGERRTLYRFFTADPAKLKAIICNDECIAANWKPVPATANDKPVGNWRPMEVAPGQYQWAYKAGLVFTFLHDKRPGDAFGDKFAGMESPWSPILLSTLILSAP